MAKIDQKKYKKVVLEEESENESDIEYEQDPDTDKEAPEEIPQIKKPRKKNLQLTYLTK